MSASRIRFLAVGLLFLVFLLLAYSFSSMNVGGVSDASVNVHLTWRQGDMSSTMVVTWQSKYADSGSTVAYDNVSRTGNVTLYRYSANATTHTYAGASGYLHDAELTGLIPDSTYYFVCGGEKGGYSSERSFQTAPTHPSYLRFVVGGDSRSNLAERDTVSRAMRGFDPSFVLFLGDMVDNGTSQPEWDDFLGSLDALWVGTNNLTIPIVPTLGGHELNSTNYFEQFALPGNERWYSLDWGNLAHIAVLDSEANATGEQLAWLENDLSTHENFTFKFVIFHQPVFSSSTHGSWLEGRQDWVPVFDKHHVSAVFSGHDHDYERSLPINYTASDSSPQPSYTNGTMYVVSGGWGAPLYTKGTSWWTAFSKRAYNFVLIDAYANGTLSLQAKDDSGVTFDTSWDIVPVPEFPSALILSLLLIVTMAAVIIYKRKNTFKIHSSS